MNEEEQKFKKIGASIPEAEISQMFGKPCLKVNGKAFACFAENEMVFKLPKDTVAEALKLKGAKLFDPSGKNRPMKEWVQVPATHAKEWEALAGDAFKYLWK